MMEDSEFDRLHKEVITPVAENEEPLTKLERIRQQLESAVKDGSLQIVDREEVALIVAFRKWKQSPQVTSGIFHYRRYRR